MDIDEYLAAGYDHETAESMAGIDAICRTRTQAVESLGAEGREQLDEDKAEKKGSADSVEDERVEFYLAAGHDRENAEAMAGADAICAAWTQAVESLGDEGRERLDNAYTESNEAIDADPENLAARNRAGEQHRRGERVQFDITKRAEEIRRHVFAAHARPRTAPAPKTHAAGTASTANGNGTVVRRAESSGAPRASSPGSSRSRSPSSSDDDPHEAAPAERRCRNSRCGRLFSTQDRRRRYCDECSPKAKDSAFRHRVGRDPLTADELDVDDLNLLAGTAADPRTLCKRKCSREPYTGSANSVCHYCSKPRDGIRGFIDNDGLPRRAPSLVNVRNPKHGTLKRKRRRYPVTVTYADGSQETVTRAELTRRSEREVAAA
jgi:hypothetical protein